MSRFLHLSENKSYSATDSLLFAAPENNLFLYYFGVEGFRWNYRKTQLFISFYIFCRYWNNSRLRSLDYLEHFIFKDVELRNNCSCKIFRCLIAKISSLSHKLVRSTSQTFFGEITFVRQTKISSTKLRSPLLIIVYCCFRLKQAQFLLGLQWKQEAPLLIVDSVFSVEKAIPPDCIESPNDLSELGLHKNQQIWDSIAVLMKTGSWELMLGSSE